MTSNRYDDERFDGESTPIEEVVRYLDSPRARFDTPTMTGEYLTVRSGKLTTVYAISTTGGHYRIHN